MKDGWNQVDRNAASGGTEPAPERLVALDLLTRSATQKPEVRRSAVKDGSPDREFVAAAIFVAVAATIVVAPMLVLGTVSGRDFPFHLASWMDVAQQWHHGTIYPRWAELANWGLGEPRFVFYPPGSWMLGAALGSLFPWKVVPTLFVWLVLMGAGVCMFLLTREFLAARQAVLAAVLYAANPYHLLLVYYRSDFAELLAGAFFPLLAWGVLRIARDGWRGVPFLAAVVAAIWLCNAPAAVIAVYSVVFLLLIAYSVERDRRLLLHGSAAVAGGFGLAAFYILPAARERAWVQINRVLSDGLRPEQNFLFTRASGAAVNMDFNIKISYLVLLMAVLAAVAAYFIAKSKEIPRLPYALVVALGAMSFFMMFSVSRPLWWIAPELHFVQFPWRYAVPFAVAVSFLIAAAVGNSNKLAICAVVPFVFAGPLAKTLLAMERPSSWTKAEISRLKESIDNGVGYRGTPEYLPNGASGVGLGENSGTDLGMAGNSSQELPTVQESHGQYAFLVESAQPRQITFKLFDYPTWHVHLEGSRVDSKRRDSDGHIVALVPPGEHVIHIVMQREWDAKLGIAISIASAMFLLGLTVKPWLTSKSQAAESMRCGLPATSLQRPAFTMRNKV